MPNLAKQKVCPRYIYKINSSRLRKAKWDLTLPITEAKRNDELVALADSQVLRWIDELRNVTDADEIAKKTKAQIRRLRKEPSSLQNRRLIKKLYEELDAVQFKKDYLCVVMDKPSDYRRAAKGFKVNGVSYHRLLGTNGGVKNETIVFVSDDVRDEIKKRISNGRDLGKELVPAKLEAYQALTCSASIPVSSPKGLIVVNDCETTFTSDVIYLNDELEGEPVMEYRADEPIELNESDGYGIILPALAERWGAELDEDYVPSGFNTRYAWEKGMVFTFDFLDFAEKEVGSYKVIDAWGAERDLRDAEMILTTSMLKLWDSYESCEHYIKCCENNKYQFGIAKVCPEELENEHNLNYQFIQSYDLSDEDIDELIAPTMDEIEDILHSDWRKTILFLRGTKLGRIDVAKSESDCAKALMADSRMIDDPYIQSKVYQLIKNRINEAKVGVIKVHGNYSMVSGDPYSLCQHMCGLPVTGLLKAGEIYNGYWDAAGAKRLVCFRAPMTCHNNIRAVTPVRSEEARYWYRYMPTATVFNSWDTAAHALNGCDKDGDLVFLTDNDVLVRNHRELPALMCVQRKARKRVVTEEDLIQANLDSFGNDIGATTNRVTTMFDVQAGFSEGSREHEILEYRIRCGQLYQQNSIDKTKGIISKAMPREWYDAHRATKIEDPEERAFYMSILADKKPYFMRYIYPDLMRKYNKYVDSVRRKALREFGKTLDELLVTSEDALSPEESNFIFYYHRLMPVSNGNCATNRICRKFEETFDGCLKEMRKRSQKVFDYGIMKSGTEYTTRQRNSIFTLWNDYNRRLKDYKVYSARERIDADDAAMQMVVMRDEFRAACDSVCDDSKVLCDILLDICYQKENTKKFAWDMCGDEIIENLLDKNGWQLSYPVQVPDGEISFCGMTFDMVRIDVPKEVENADCIE